MTKPTDYKRVEEAIRYIAARASEQPSLDEVAAHLGLSPFYFQRLFKRWAGVSPKRFLQYVTVEGAKRLLDESASVLDAALELGLSGPSRLHDLFIGVEAVTPGEFKASGRGIELRYGVHASPFGVCFVATSSRGVCALEFLDAAEGGSAAAVAALRRRWKEAVLVEDGRPGAGILAAMFGTPGDAAFGASTKDSPKPITLHLEGTNFQLKVWKALLSIPEGRLASYGRLADIAGVPGSARAVGTALGQNPIALLIPCHRVLRATGEIGGYRWGVERKKAIIAWEASSALPEPTH
ncbi:MAG: methylated-DNA--[protein]-cysteine S-methyltransferase [Spirochaetes bacterium]|nr:methylated-DNA--[protein]-cysteine S-methyltransferase [Spirochaetota bacterium]